MPACAGMTRFFPAAVANRPQPCTANGTRASATFGTRLEAQAWIAETLEANSRLDAPTRDIDRALLGTVNASAPRARSEVRHG